MMNGKGKGPLSIEQNPKKQRKWDWGKIGLIEGGYVLGKRDEEEKFRLARVIKTEPIKMPPEEFQVHNDMHYRYYVTFPGLDRRWDCFISRENILVDQEQIQAAIDDYETSEKKEKDEKSTIFENDENKGMDEKAVQLHINATKVKNILRIVIGDNMTPTWYYSPYPEPYHSVETMYICEYCLSYFACREEQVRHSYKCQMYHPPGDEIYRCDQLSVFEVNSSYERIYCENLCLLSKLFLDHKNLFNETEIFLFYVLTEYVDGAYHFVGYYSKQKESVEGYNLNCIFVLPFYQRKGYGKFLITFSFELSLIEGKLGTPEVPLSDLGFLSYLSWWSQRLADLLLKCEKEEMSIDDISKETAMKLTDVVMVLERLNILRYHQGQHVIFAEKGYLEALYKLAGRPPLAITRSCLHWTPYILPGSNKMPGPALAPAPAANNHSSMSS